MISIIYVFVKTKCLKIFRYTFSHQSIFSTNKPFKFFRYTFVVCTFIATSFKIQSGPAASNHCVVSQIVEYTGVRGRVEGLLCRNFGFASRRQRTRCLERH